MQLIDTHAHLDQPPGPHQRELSRPDMAGVIPVAAGGDYSAGNTPLHIGHLLWPLSQEQDHDLGVRM